MMIGHKKTVPSSNSAEMLWFQDGPGRPLALPVERVLDAKPASAAMLKEAASGMLGWKGRSIRALGAESAIRNEKKSLLIAKAEKEREPVALFVGQILGVFRCGSARDGGGLEGLGAQGEMIAPDGTRARLFDAKEWSEKLRGNDAGE